jgi:hypothetical protein
MAQAADTFSPHSEGSCLFVVDSQPQADRQAASLYSRVAPSVTPKKKRSEETTWLSVAQANPCDTK